MANSKKVEKMITDNGYRKLVLDEIINPSYDGKKDTYASFRSEVELCKKFILSSMRINKTIPKGGPTSYAFKHYVENWNNFLKVDDKVSHVDTDAFVQAMYELDGTKNELTGEIISIDMRYPLNHIRSGGDTDSKIKFMHNYMFNAVLAFNEQAFIGA